MNVSARLCVNMLRSTRALVRRAGFEPAPVRLANVRASYRAIRRSLGT